MKLNIKRGSSDKWTVLNPILEDGQFGLERPIYGTEDSYFKLKIGDGHTPWNDLPYIGSSELSSILSEISDLKDRVSSIERRLNND